MNKGGRKKEEDVIRKIMKQEVVNLQNVVVINAPENKAIVEELDSSIIVRILNLHSIKPSELASDLLKIWDIEKHVRARLIGHDRIQFYFDRKSELKRILSKAP